MQKRGSGATAASRSNFRLETIKICHDSIVSVLKLTSPSELMGGTILRECVPSSFDAVSALGGTAVKTYLSWALKDLHKLRIKRAQRQCYSGIATRSRGESSTVLGSNATSQLPCFPCLVVLVVRERIAQRKSAYAAVASAFTGLVVPGMSRSVDVADCFV